MDTVASHVSRSISPFPLPNLCHPAPTSAEETEKENTSVGGRGLGEGGGSIICSHLPFPVSHLAERDECIMNIIFFCPNFAH